MDPITTAILAAAPSLASELAGSVVKDAYAGLKAVIQRKWGADSEIYQAVDAVEANPQSKARTAVLEEEVGNAGAKDDREVLDAVAKLAEALQSAGIAREQMNNIKVAISGGTVQGVVGAHNVTVTNLNFGNGPKTGKR